MRCAQLGDWSGCKAKAPEFLGVVFNCGAKAKVQPLTPDLRRIRVHGVAGSRRHILECGV